jgi:hypothetical protein
VTTDKTAKLNGGWRKAARTHEAPEADGQHSRNKAIASPSGLAIRALITATMGGMREIKTVKTIDIFHVLPATTSYRTIH